MTVLLTKLRDLIHLICRNSWWKLQCVSSLLPLGRAHGCFSCELPLVERGKRLNPQTPRFVRARVNQCSPYQTPQRRGKARWGAAQRSPERSTGKEERASHGQRWPKTAPGKESPGPPPTSRALSGPPRYVPAGCAPPPGTSPRCLSRRVGPVPPCRSPSVHSLPARCRTAGGHGRPLTTEPSGRGGAGRHFRRAGRDSDTWRRGGRGRGPRARRFPVFTGVKLPFPARLAGSGSPPGPAAGFAGLQCRGGAAEGGRHWPRPGPHRRLGSAPCCPGITLCYPGSALCYPGSAPCYPGSAPCCPGIYSVLSRECPGLSWRDLVLPMVPLTLFHAPSRPPNRCLAKLFSVLNKTKPSQICHFI